MLLVQGSSAGTNTCGKESMAEVAAGAVTCPANAIVPLNLLGKDGVGAGTGMKENWVEGLSPSSAWTMQEEAATPLVTLLSRSLHYKARKRASGGGLVHFLVCHNRPDFVNPQDCSSSQGIPDVICSILRVTLL